MDFKNFSVSRNSASGGKNVNFQIAISWKPLDIFRRDQNWWSWFFLGYNIFEYQENLFLRVSFFRLGVHLTLELPQNKPYFIFTKAKIISNNDGKGFILLRMYCIIRNTAYFRSKIPWKRVKSLENMIFFQKFLLYILINCVKEVVWPKIQLPSNFRPQLELKFFLDHFVGLA